MADSSENEQLPNGNRGRFESEPVPDKGCLLGIDYGTVRLGLAVSDSKQTIASPAENYTLRDPQANERYLRKIVEEYAVVGVVVGLPVHMSGDEGGMAEEARQYGQWLSNTVQRPICFWDERLTSSIAEEVLMSAELSKAQRKRRLDMLAAQVMLQSFLDAPDRKLIPGRYP